MITQLVSTLSTKGQIVIPAEVRTRLALQEGDRIAFLIADDGAVVIERVLTRQQRIEKWLDAALATYDEPHAWAAIDGEAFSED